MKLTVTIDTVFVERMLNTYFEKARGTLVVVRPAKYMKKKTGKADGTKIRQLLSIINSNYTTFKFNGRTYMLRKIEKNPIRIYYSLMRVRK